MSLKEIKDILKPIEQKACEAPQTDRSEKDFYNWFASYAVRELMKEAQKKGEPFKPYDITPRKYGLMIKEIVKLFYIHPNYNRFLVIAGQHGSGKTFHMKVLSQFLAKWNQDNFFKPINEHKLLEEVEQGGRNALNMYSMTKLCINDYGKNNPVIKWFGNEINILQELIYKRYEDRGLCTYFTTNLKTKEEFLATLDERLKQRVEPKLDFMYLTGRNFRKD